LRLTFGKRVHRAIEGFGRQGDENGAADEWENSKALDVLLTPPSNRNVAKRARWSSRGRKTPVVALAARLFVAGSFVIGQPIVAEPTTDISVRAGGAFAALQDFVQTQRVVSLDFIPAPSGKLVSSARDPYSVLSEFVQVTDASGMVPLPIQAQAAAPNDAIHSGARANATSREDAYSVLTDFVRSADDSGMAATSAHGQAPDDAIHAGLHAAAGETAMLAQAPDDAIHAGMKGAAKTGSHDYSALRDFAAGKDDEKPMVLAAAASEAPKATKPDASTSGPATYVGSQACVRCHRDQFGSFSQTLHGEIFLKHPRDAQEKEGCESCHGPGSNHVKTKEADSGGPGDIISFSKDAPRPVAERNAICLSCHERGDRTYWDGSTHDTRGLACTSCHQIMEKVSVKFQLLKATEPETCFQCHKDIRAKMVNSSHMPVENGSMACSSCHNPHGSATDGLLREASVNETCYKCHADKRGPFLWEHEPVRDNCLNCHNPHGSVNEYMLTIQRPRLCQSCHMGPGHGNPGNPMTVQAVNRSCQNCHTMVHGSNSPAGALFQR
jgi:DmsE family decaheme c-type cytochrome